MTVEQPLPSSDISVVPLEKIGAQHLHTRLMTTGEVLTVQPPKVRLVTGVFECQRCHKNMTCAQSAPDRFDPPENCGTCGCTELELLPELSEWMDYQEFQLREHGVNDERPRVTFCCRVEGALVGRFPEGAFISITVMPVPSEQMFSTFEIVLEVLDLEEVGS